jgi:hypothetical protein
MFAKSFLKAAAQTAASAAETAAQSAASAADTARNKYNEDKKAKAAAAAAKAAEAEKEKEAARHEELIEFRKAHTAAIEEKVRIFLETPKVAEFYARPGAAKADTGAAAIARRLAPFALKAIEYTGYGRAVAAVKAVIKYKDVAAVLLHPTFREVCGEVVPRLIKPAQDEGLEFTSGMPVQTELALRLWYLGCTEAMGTMTAASVSAPDEGRATAAAASNATSEAEVSDERLRLLAEWVGPAQWLSYAHKLPPPHTAPEWAAWFASRLAAKAGWCVIACHGAAKQEACVVPAYPHKTRVPSWLLAAQPQSKRVVLAIRGTHTPEDALIDADHERAVWESAVGGRHVCHRGMLRAARAILDDCGCRAALELFRSAEYSLTLVGHSLGAGVASVLTALLTLGEKATRSDPTAPPPPPQPPPFARVVCIAYACPSCVDKRLAELLKPSVLAAVHNDDVVPRLNDANFRQLALELLKDDPMYHKRFVADKAAYKEYVRTLGRTQAMSHEGQMDEGGEGDDGGGSAASAASGTAPGPAPADERLADERAASPPVGLEQQQQPTAEEEEQVVPGNVVYLEGREAFIRAFEGDHRLPALGRIVVTQRAVSDHKMSTYATALRALWHRRGHTPAKRPPVPFAPVMMPSGIGAGAAMAGADGGKGLWRPCSVCGSDVTWTAMAKGSDALRVHATKHCRACGEVCCAFCAPAGDRISGDRLGEFATLSDLRVPMPSQDYLQPVRICMPCSFRAHEI